MKKMQIKDSDRAHEVLAWVVTAFTEEDALSRRESYFYRDEIGESIPEGKAVRVTFEYVDAGVLCNGGNDP